MVRLKEAILILGTTVLLVALISCRLDDNTLRGSAASLPVQFKVSGTLKGVPAADTATYTLTINNDSGSAISSFHLPALTEPLSIASNTCQGSLASGEFCVINIIYTSPGKQTLAVDFPVEYTLGGKKIQKLFILDVEGTVNPVLSLQGLYSSNGANWNDYVANDGVDVYQATGAACSGTGTAGYFETCIHGGEKKTLTLTQLSSCSDFTISDALGVFDWICDDSSAPPIVIRSVGLKKDKNLSDLVTVKGWIPNQVIITSGGFQILATPLEAWWQNNVLPIPDNDGGASQITLTNGGESSGRIYVADGNINSAGYFLSEDKMALVTTAGSKLTKNGTSTGEFIRVEKAYNWIEGHYDGNDVITVGQPFIFPAGFTFLRARNLRISGGTRGFQGLVLRHSYVENLTVQNTTAPGLYLSYARFNTFYKIRVQTPDSTSSIQIGDSVYSKFFNLTITGGSTCLHVFYGNRGLIFHDIVTYNCGYPGVRDYYNYDNTYTKIVSSNTRAGVEVQESKDVTLSHITASAAGSGVDPSRRAADITINQVAIVGNSTGTFSNTTSAPLTSYRMNFSQFATANNELTNFNFRYSENNFFTNLLLVGTGVTPVCMVTANSSNPGLALSGTDCINQNASNSTIRSGIDASNSFVEVVTTTDPANSSNTDGVKDFADITDWFNFSNRYRVWGKNDATFPSTSSRGRCETGTCQIWDWRLKASDTVLRNRSNDGISANQPFVAGGACPAAVHGNKTLTDTLTLEKPGIDGNDNGVCEGGETCNTPNVFLINAMEIVMDSIGDDDGLCESNEACIYSPNFGAYQGEGDYESNGTCTFQNGTVTGVIMYAYPINGAP